MTLDWIWFIALTLTSWALGRHAARALESDDSPTAQFISQGAGILSLVVSWPIVGKPLMEWMLVALPDGTQALSEATAIIILGVGALIWIAAPVLVWILPDAFELLRRPSIENQTEASK